MLDPITPIEKPIRTSGLALYAVDPDDRFAIAPSTIPGAGDGLFAKVPLAREETLEVTGVLIEADSPLDQCTRYADPYKFRLGNYLLIPLGYAALINHSSHAANLEKHIREQTLVLRTLRSIDAGEELFLCYGEAARAFFPHGD